LKRYILTGTPGSGKTSIIKALQANGYSTIEEAATDIILESQATGNLEPWTQPSFVDKIVTLQKQRQIKGATLTCETQFHDRSAICSYALSKYLGFLPSPILTKEIDRIEKDAIFQKEVFFIENLGFCLPSAVRKISFEDSLVFEKLHIETYLSFNYKIIKIAKNSISERMNEFLGYVNRHNI
jgi:predicted ATPase